MSVERLILQVRATDLQRLNAIWVKSRSDRAVTRIESIPGLGPSDSVIVNPVLTEGSGDVWSMGTTDDLSVAASEPAWNTTADDHPLETSVVPSADGRGWAFLGGALVGAALALAGGWAYLNVDFLKARIFPGQVQAHTEVTGVPLSSASFVVVRPIARSVVFPMDLAIETVRPRRLQRQADNLARVKVLPPSKPRKIAKKETKQDSPIKDIIREYNKGQYPIPDN